MTGSRTARPLALFLVLAVLAACATPATPAPSGTPPPAAAASVSPTSPPTPASTVTPTTPPAPAATASPSPTPTSTPSPTPPPTRVPATPAGPTVDEFWARAERGIRDAGRLEVAITGPANGTLRFEPDASATVIEDVIGFVCLAGRAYDGQSGFTRLPGTWACGAGALGAGFRGIGQPIDAWNGTIPTDNNRLESLVVEGGRWTWRYRATSPYYGGAVTASVTLDPATRRIVAARREDPTGSTRYAFAYGADFPPIALPR